MANWPLVVADKFGLLSTCCYRTRSGLTVWCRARSTDVNEAVAILSGFEYPTRFLRVSHGSVIFDLGANIGSFALLVAALNHGIDFRGIAFEPFIPNFNMLTRNLAANGISTFSTVDAAVTGVDGRVRLASDGAPDQVRVADPSETRAEVLAKSCRLSTYCATNGISSIELLKMDVEGSEYDIVEADLDFIKACIANLLIEYHQVGGTRTEHTLRDRLEPDFAITAVHERSRTGVLHARNMRLREHPQ